MTDHEICRLNLKSAIEAMQDSEPGGRRVRADVTGDCKIANAHHYWVKVSDTVLGRQGHARFIDYEVEACCRWAARCEALDQHAAKFDAAKEED